MLRPRLLCTALFGLALACGGDNGSGGSAADDESGDDGIVSFTGATDSQGDSSTGGGDDTTSAGTLSGGGVGGLNCRNVDFVFVIDNSASMADEQQHLVDAVPGFVDAMQTTLPLLETIRVGVVDTDTFPALGNPDPLDGCPDDGTDCASCDYTLGAFLGKPGSAMDPAASCSFSTGTNVMDGTAATFADEFACAAIVGTDGNPVEQQAGALVEAVGKPLNDTGACNESFVREDALLIFLVISDEEDDHAHPPTPQGGSEGDPERWYQAVVDAKDGMTPNIVSLGLLGGSPRFPDCTDLSVGNDGAEQSSRLQQFVDMFDSNFTGSVCSQGYDAFFVEALEAVAKGCMNFIP